MESDFIYCIQQSIATINFIRFGATYDEYYNEKLASMKRRLRYFYNELHNISPDFAGLVVITQFL